MKNWFAKLTIGLYLSMSFIGIAAHAMNFGTNSHPAMYYFVWDMFCGWAAHEIRTNDQQRSNDQPTTINDQPTTINDQPSTINQSPC